MRLPASGWKATRPVSPSTTASAYWQGGGAAHSPPKFWPAKVTASCVAAREESETRRSVSSALCATLTGSQQRSVQAHRATFQTQVVAQVGGAAVCSGEASRRRRAAWEVRNRAASHVLARRLGGHHLQRLRAHPSQIEQYRKGKQGTVVSGGSSLMMTSARGHSGLAHALAWPVKSAVPSVASGPVAHVQSTSKGAGRQRRQAGRRWRWL